MGMSRVYISKVLGGATKRAAWTSRGPRNSFK